MSLQSRRSWWRVLFSNALSASVSLQLRDQRGEDAQEQLEHLCADQTWGFEWVLSRGSLSITMHSLLVFGVNFIKIWLVFKNSSRLSTAFSHLEITLLWMPLLLYSLFSSCCSEIGASLVLRAAAPEARSRHSHKRDWQGIKLSQSIEKNESLLDTVASCWHHVLPFSAFNLICPLQLLLKDHHPVALLLGLLFCLQNPLLQIFPCRRFKQETL